MASNSVKGGCLVLVALAFSSTLLMGQTSTASLSDKIEDPSGAALPGASVMVTNTETNETRNTVSDSAGSYLLFRCPWAGMT